MCVNIEEILTTHTCIHRWSYGVGWSSRSFSYLSRVGVKTASDCRMTVWSQSRNTAGHESWVENNHWTSLDAQHNVIHFFHSNTLLSCGSGILPTDSVLISFRYFVFLKCYSGFVNVKNA